MDNPSKKNKKTREKQKRCKKGTRRNHKTNECEPIIKEGINQNEPERQVPTQEQEQELQRTQEQELPPLRTETQIETIRTQEQEQEQELQRTQEQEQEQELPQPLQTKEPRVNDDKELRERMELSSDNKYDFLYPNLNDANFNIKIAERKEFNDTKYDGDIVADVEKHSNQLCNSEFELAPHQLFVRNFLSFQTPYNSLLLYHGLGSGKTCSAISVAEEMRDYIINIGITSQIIIVASPNVQSNFRLQLFDERKLKLVNGLWNIRSCTGNKFLKEINPMNMKGLSRENVKKQINKIIDTYYIFFGYLEFSNYISKKSNLDNDGIEIRDEKHKQKLIQGKLRKIFNNRLLIIDEFHNIRITDDNKNKRVADELLKLIKNVNNIRLLLLSGTPMFNSYKEIIWLINLMNINDRRSTIDIKDVFNKDGTFKVSSSGEEIGKQLLERKATGYISVVRGENPYTFPYRVWPSDFANQHTFSVKPYPTIQLNGISELKQSIQHLSLFLTEIGNYQQKGYNYIIERIKGGHIGTNNQMPTVENIETYGYTMLMQPLEGLNIIYPHDSLDKEDKNLNSIELVGGEGLKRIMNFTVDPSTYSRSKFDYKPDVIKNYGRLFSPNEIGNYSSKIKTICDRIVKSKGVILVYSQYIDAGLVPLALALEEQGFSRAGNTSSLFSSNPTKKVKGFNYVMITGDKGFSPNPTEDIKLATNDNNINGEIVKVILISQTGTEGLDLKFIRQVHVMEPWYNMNRIEQIFGRAIRTCSHKLLPFNERNVELYLYASLMRDNGMEETADLYIYRLAEIKALQIGKVSRVLKEISVDCILNIGQTNFTEENMELNGVKPITLEISSGDKIDNYKIGDKPYSSICDYMENCAYKCRPNKEIAEDDVSLSTYSEDYIMTNTDKIIYRIKQLMKERFFYNKRDMVALINSFKVYPIIQINAALEQLVSDKNEFINDKYDRTGHLINIDDLYLFQPLEIKDERISIFDRSVPLDVKHSNIIMRLPKEKQEKEKLTNIINIGDKQSHSQTHAPAFEKDEISKLIDKLEKKYNLAVNHQTIPRGEKDWYMLCNKSTEFMLENGIERDTINYLIVEHIIDELNLKEMLMILNVFYENPEKIDKYNNENLFKHIKMYIHSKIIIGKRRIKGFLWKDKSIQVILVKQHVREDTETDNKMNKKWYIAESEDEKDLKEVIEMKKLNIMKNLNNTIGFMINFKNDDNVVFKTKDTLNERDLGARCDQKSDKNKEVDLLNSIIGKKIFTIDTDISLRGICIIQELYLRLFERDRNKEKHWFLTSAESLLTSIDKKVKKTKGKGKGNVVGKK